jgi:hypothetical protein
MNAIVKLPRAGLGRRLWTGLFSVGAAALLTACQTPAEPKVVTKVVNVPVAAKCVPANFRDPPAFPDTDEAIRSAPGPGELLQLLAAGRVLYRQWIAEAVPVISGCR